MVNSAIGKRERTSFEHFLASGDEERTEIVLSYLQVCH